MKRLFHCSLLALKFAVVMLPLLVISCAGDQSGSPQESTGQGGLRMLRSSLADGIVLFGFCQQDRHYFLQHVDSRMGDELTRGDWDMMHWWNVTTPVIVGNEQFIVGHGQDKNTFSNQPIWFIQKVHTTGDLGADETDSGKWKNLYETLVGFQVGNRAFIFGQNMKNHHWFIQEILRDGRLAPHQSDSGNWHTNYHTVVPLYVSGRTYLYGQNRDDKFWFIKEVTEDGVLHDRHSGYWNNYYPVNLAYELDGQTYLFGHRAQHQGSGDGGPYWGKGYWFIQRINSDGSMGAETDSGEWDNFYATMAAYETDGRAFLFGQNTDRYWFIQEVYSNGRMGPQTDGRGRWDRYYNNALPFAFDTAYAHHDDWMGYLSSTIGNRKLTDITIPGSHDAGMNEKDKHSCNLGSSCNTITQTGRIIDQLNRGSRFFDLRPTIYYYTDSYALWYTGHWQVQGAHMYGCGGEYKETIVDGLKRFFGDQNHKKELVIIRLSHCQDKNGGNHSCLQSQRDLCAAGMAADLSDLLVKCDDCNPVQMTLNQLLAKGNIILQVEDVTSDKKKGIFKWDNHDNTGLALYDKYSYTESYPTMRNDQANKLALETQAGNHLCQLFLFSWTLTLNTTDVETCLFTGKNILDQADTANRHLMSDMTNMVAAGNISRARLPNILYVDAFDTFATRAAIYVNKARNNVALWSSGTGGNAGATRVMQEDGNLVIYKDGKALWDSGTWGNPGAHYEMQGDGNFVIYSTDHQPLWATDTWGHPGAYERMQSDGNFVIYSEPWDR